MPEDPTADGIPTAIAYLDEFIESYRVYLQSLPKNKPPRSIDKYLSALRLKLEFTKAKPAAKVDLDAKLSGGLKIEVEHI